MRKCAYCDKEELVGVGKDNTPVCEEHYNEYLNKAFKPLRDIRAVSNETLSNKSN